MSLLRCFPIGLSDSNSSVLVGVVFEEASDDVGLGESWVVELCFDIWEDVSEDCSDPFITLDGFSFVNFPSARADNLEPSFPDVGNWKELVVGFRQEKVTLGVSFEFPFTAAGPACGFMAGPRKGGISAAGLAA